MDAVAAKEKHYQLIVEKWEARRSGAGITIRAVILSDRDRGAKIILTGIATITTDDKNVVALDADSNVVAALSC